MSQSENDPKPEPADRCPDCGRSPSTHLSLTEAQARFGYARTDCLSCRLTDHERSQRG